MEVLKCGKRDQAMAAPFTPILTVLDPAQRRLWDDFTSVPGEFALCGGTAVALRLGHRRSVDFDFFGTTDFDPDELCRQVPFLAQSRVLQKSHSTLTCAVDRGEPVKVSFFGVPTLRRVETPSPSVDTGLAVASLIDLAGMKVAVVQKRAEAKDYIDIDAILCGSLVGLPDALAAASVIYGSSFNPQISLKALSYFQDGNLPTLPRDIQDRLARAVQNVDLDRLPRVP